MPLPLHSSDKIVITGAAGQVGQNLCLMLREAGYRSIVALDKRADNLAVLAQLNPGIHTVLADLAAEDDSWRTQLAGCKALILLHAHIGSLNPQEFIADNVTATAHLLDACRHYQVPWVVHASSSVVNSVVVDDYTESKKQQEQLVHESEIPHVILRPTLMFGWFDRKHLGWLARLMRRVPVFPIPGHGHYARQPLYVRDFCRIILQCLAKRPADGVYDISGKETISYRQMIEDIKHVTQARACILPLPVWLFGLLLDVAGLYTRTPPFTRKQMEALMAPDHFPETAWEQDFAVEPTPWRQAIAETLTHPEYSHVALRF